MHEERLIEAELTAQPLDIGLGAFLAQHVVDRVADKAEHGECHEPRHDEDEDRLANAPDGVCEHLTSGLRDGERRPSKT